MLSCIMSIGRSERGRRTYQSELGASTTWSLTVALWVTVNDTRYTLALAEHLPCASMYGS